ncbi:Metallo-dependent phosphatase-like protein [Phellopilus nigrolimitatus]|nr:Metallo-dependent phosphatase-like protein [Phellopilus nigrolimitatus]
MNMTFVVFSAAATAASAQTLSFGPSAFTAPGAFPTSVYASYYNDPTQTSAQVQPVISDPVTHETYPFELTNPDTIPTNDTADPHPLPSTASSSTILAQALRQIQLIASPETPNSPFLNNSCASCQAALGIAKFVALAAPEQGPAAVIGLCEAFELSHSCSTTYSANSLGSVITQVLANADVLGYDGQLFCQNFLGACPLPPTSALNLTGWFAKPKPDPLPAPKTPSGTRLKVLHLSDFHIDPRYTTGAEANCTSSLCCREGNVASNSPNQTLFPAPRFGSYLCDTPYSLALSALQAIPALSGTQESGFAFTVYTGDLVSHDPENELSRAYVEYTETVLYDLFRRMLGSGPVYAALGNHDTHNEAQDAPHSLGGALGEQFSWNYDHVAGLWAHEDWLPDAAVALARAHYGAYMVRRQDGLRVITLNTDFWYTANLFNYINLTTADTSGMLRFLTDELQDAEDAGDRVWILGHVLSGWDGTNPLENPTNLFYQIVDRFSPHVIANIFFGHTHEDQLSIFYANNGTNMSAATAQAVSWIVPSITPLTNLNSGFRVYEVDSNTFDIVDAHTWRADVNSFPALDDQLAVGPTYAFEYDTRTTYGQNITGWGPDDPLNATWWHLVTEAMEADSSLVTTFNTFQGKGSVRTQACTGECIAAKICYMRSGSASIAFQNCPSGFGSVQ